MRQTLNHLKQIIGLVTFIPSHRWIQMHRRLITTAVLLASLLLWAAFVFIFPAVFPTAAADSLSGSTSILERGIAVTEYFNSFSNRQPSDWFNWRQPIAYAWPRPLAAMQGGPCVSLTTLGSAYTQNFDTLSNTAGSTTNNLTITGWFMTEGGGGARDNEQYAVDTGGSTTGDTYSYGAAGSTERALGQLRSGTLIPLFGACFTNNTGATITSLSVAYNGEEWRLGTAGRTDQMNFEYSTNATDLVTGTWTNAAALNFITPDTATVGAKNGNAAADRTALSSTISSLSIANGATFWIRWNDADASGADDGLAVDDFSLTPNAIPPVNLSINDVSLNEGNAGTTAFTFTVSLSAPAGPGGVTFDIATADGTATQPGDYTQKSLTSQTIPAGSSTYSFTVLVNGDTTPETNETFFVNVTNVTGATVTDGQGQGTIVNDDAAPNLTINDVTLNEGNAGTTIFTFTVSLSAPAGAGGVTFDIATANGTATAPGDYTAKSLTGQTIPAGSSTYTFDVLVNGDTTAEPDETFFVNVTNITNAIGVDTQGQGTIANDDITKIHDVQGNGAATPIPGATVSVEGVVTANFQGTNKLQGFFLQEEDADADADPNTSEGIFIFCSSCPTPVAEGQRVKATGTVSEFNNMTEITASTAGSVVVTDAGNHLAEVTPSPIDLPIVGDINAFYEAREGMKVTFVDTLTVSEYSDLGRFGQIELYEGGRPRQFTEGNAPSVAGNTAYQDNLARRHVILDDDNNAQEWYLTTSSPAGPADGFQYVFYPRANGGFSVGTQGLDFFRGGDLVNGLTGILHWSFSGASGTDAWRIRPTNANPTSFTVANPRPATPPAVGGAVKVVGMNLLNYFTTIDTTSSNSTGPCGPSGNQDCRGADSVAELNRQRERASIVVCTLNADIYGFMELENTTPSATITDLLGAVNARCGGAHPYAFVNTGGTLGTDAIRVQLIYRTGVVSPVGSPLVDLDPVHNRPPTAQTFDVVDATNPAFGQRFTVIANHFKSKGCPGTGADADLGDGQGCFNGTRVAQANRLLTWINGTVIPAAGDPDVLLLGDFNSYAHEDPVTTIEAGGYTDLETLFHGANAYSYLFSGQLGHLDYGFASASLLSKVTGADAWHINADEVDLFDYNDEVKDTGESTFEEKPDGSALTPPRVVFAPGTPYRASDHDPVIVGLFPVADLSITKTDGVTTATPGGSVTYTITASNAGPSNEPAATVADTFPAALTCTWTCVGAGGGTCTASGSGNINDTANLPAGGSVTYTASCTISAAASGTLSNTATITSGSTSDSNAANNSATDADTLTSQADLSITKTDGVTTATPGGAVTYTITASNAGPSNATGATVADTFPASLTCTWTCVGAGGGTCTASGSGNINNTVNLPAGGSVTYTASCSIAASATGTLSNTATVAAPGGVTDPTPGNNSATDSDTLSPRADLAITKTDGVTTVTAGGSVTYTITASNAGPSNATGATVADTFPASLTCTWTCVGAGGGTCTASGSGNINGTVNLPSGGSVTYTASCTISAGATGTLSNTATVTAPGGVTDPTPGNNSATDTDSIACPTITVTNPATTTGTAGAPFSQTFTQSGGNGTTTFSTASALPAGLTLAANGTLSGTPTQTGTFPVTVKATDSNGCMGTGATYTLVINCQTITVTAPATNTGTANAPFSATFMQSGGIGTTSFTTASALPSGLSLSTAGVLSGTPTQSGTFPITVKATDANGCSGTANYTLTIQGIAPAVTAHIDDPLACTGPGNKVSVTATVTNPNATPQSANFTATLTPTLRALAGSCSANVGTCTVVNFSTVTWSGTLNAGQTVTITYQAQVNDGTLPGEQLCATSVATVGNGLPATVTACGTVNCPAVGPGALPQAVSPVSDQRAGSVLIFNVYTSSASSTQQNTRIALTNTNPTLPAFVHLFLVDGSSCSVADSMLCLTANQTTSFLASDLDPGTTGYIVAVATDAAGCPRDFNYLIGDEYVKFSSGQAANLGAEAISAIAGGLPPCDTNSTTAQLNFDGVSYNVVPRVLALDSVGSRADGNDTLLVVNRIGGNLATGTSTLGTLFGVLYDDSESGLSFSLTGGCQLRGSLSGNFPRTAPRFEQFIPSGRSGWLKLYSQSDIGITGAAINFNAGAGTSAGAFNQGHNLHVLTTTSATSYVIPVFAPGC